MICLTREVLPHLRGDMRNVFIPAEKFADSLAVSTSLSVNDCFPTGLPKTNNCSIAD